MGISNNAIIVIHWMKTNQLLQTGDAVAELGAQQISNDLIEDHTYLDNLSKLFKVRPFSETFDWKISEKKFLDGGLQHLPGDAPFAKKLYEHLGLKYTCIDFDNSPHSIRLDLNYDSVPKNHKGKYALVTNLGTTEHAANQLNAFKIIHELTALNGIMLHTLPFQGFSAHGFMGYSMQFFWMLCKSNLYNVIDVNLLYYDSYPIPANIIRFAKENSSIFVEKDHIEKLMLRDVGLVIVLQKKHDIDFVPPIDVANGTKTNDSVMKQRYWTVFDLNLLDRYLSRGKNK
ncbi:MAG: hypothetical protein HY787_23575 [Deltaproteobacteria bacterium]|nr:hypothetical protein [Deltaproteobacteria bacterium]